MRWILAQPRVLPVQDDRTRRARSFAPRLLRLNVGRRPREIGRPPRAINIVADLLYFNRSTGVFKLFLDFRSLFLVDALLDWFGRRLHEILGFFEAETGDGPDLLDHIDLLLAHRGEDHIELGLLDGRLGHRSGRSAAGRCYRHWRRRRYPPFFFEHL